jgi:tripartite-type tricarboxylate transporter receptor subunit TctC
LENLMAGHVLFAFDQATGVMSMVQSGKLRALGVASLERSPVLPDVLAIAEVLPATRPWLGSASSRARKPLPTSSPRFRPKFGRIVHAPDIAQRLRDLGAAPEGNVPEESRASLRSDTEKGRTLVRTATIKVE